MDFRWILTLTQSLPSHVHNSIKSNAGSAVRNRDVIQAYRFLQVLLLNCIWGWRLKIGSKWSELRVSWCWVPKPWVRTWWCLSSSSSSSHRGELRPLDGCEGWEASHSECSRCSHGQQPWCSENAESHTGDVGVGGGSPPPGSAYESMPRFGRLFCRTYSQNFPTLQ